MFFLLATLLVLGVILSWPGVKEAFHFVFRLAANARLRFMLCLLLAFQTAAAVDLIRRDRRSVLIGIGCASALLAAVFTSTGFTTAFQHDTAVLALAPSVVVLLLATLAAFFPGESFAALILLAAVVAELWTVGIGWNPIVPDRWMYPRVPILRALDHITAGIPSNEPFRITGNAATLFSNLSAVMGYEDIRVHDPMANARYIRMLSTVSNYDPTHYYAKWDEWEKPVVDFLNVRYVLTTPGGELPGRYRMLYDGPDGRIFENSAVLPRFYAVRDVIIDFDRPSFRKRLAELDDWSHTALLDRLAIEAPKMRDDFFSPRPADSPIASAKIVEASTTSYRIHVDAPRWSLVVGSLPWWPGWKVERNGKRIQPIRVDSAFLGFAVPPGASDVRVWYSPWTFWVGVWVALGTAVLITGSIWRSARVVSRNK